MMHAIQHYDTAVFKECGTCEEMHTHTHTCVQMHHTAEGSQAGAGQGQRGKHPADDVGEQQLGQGSVGPGLGRWALTEEHRGLGCSMVMGRLGSGHAGFPRLSPATVHFMALCPPTTSSINVHDGRILTLSPGSAVSN